MQSLDWEGITAAIKGQVTRQLSKEKEKSGADTFSKKSLDLVSCSSPPPPLRWREKFCAIKTFVFCSTIALHCFADNKRESQPKEGNISNQMPPNHLKNALLSLWSVCFLWRWREPKWPEILSSMDVCWFRRAGHAVLWLRPGKDTRHVTWC